MIALSINNFLENQFDLGGLAHSNEQKIQVKAMKTNRLNVG